MQVQKMNESVIRSMDAYCTTDMSVIAMGIRARTAGIQATFDMKVASHAGYFVWIDGELFCIEMLADGIKLSSPYDYLNNGYWGPRFVSVKRHTCWDDMVAVHSAQDYLFKACADLEIRYNPMGILEYLSPDDPRFKADNEWKYEYCSELVNRVAYRFGCGALYADENKCPPVAIQRSNCQDVVDYILSQ